jgi:hypothetical protein
MSALCVSLSWRLQVHVIVCLWSDSTAHVLQALAANRHCVLHPNVMMTVVHL